MRVKLKYIQNGENKNTNYARDKISKDWGAGGSESFWKDWKEGYDGFVNSWTFLPIVSDPDSGGKFR
jgi:hypothetical protein